MKLISFLAPLLIAASCGKASIKKNLSHTPDGKNIVYEFKEGACSTGKHSYSGIQAYCSALKDEKLNNHCAYGMRKNAFEKENCEGEFRTQGDTGKSDTPPAPKPERIDDVKFDYKITIREFASFNGEPDRAALFLIHPSRGKFEITGVESTQNMSKPFYTGALDKVITKAKVFNNSVYAVTAEDLALLQKKYPGASAIYIEHYVMKSQEL